MVFNDTEFWHCANSDKLPLFPDFWARFIPAQKSPPRHKCQSGLGKNRQSLLGCAAAGAGGTGFGRATRAARRWCAACRCAAGAAASFGRATGTARSRATTSRCAAGAAASFGRATGAARATSRRCRALAETSHAGCQKCGGQQSFKQFHHLTPWILKQGASSNALPDISNFFG